MFIKVYTNNEIRALMCRINKYGDFERVKG